jgi:hypothetical protein
MYRFSRSIYRELSPRVTEDPFGGSSVSNRQKVLDACEATIRRLAYDRRYFARPARTLFNDVRVYFPISEQVHVYRVIDRNIKLAIGFIAQLEMDGIGLDGQPAHCRASTRKGTPCQRQPLVGRDYCPSHKHLEEAFETFEGIEESLQELEPVGAAA